MRVPMFAGLILAVLLGTSSLMLDRPIIKAIVLLLSVVILLGATVRVERE
jgi:hypothetical protein